MYLLPTVWFDRAACGLFALLAFASGFLPELFVVRHPDGSIAAAFVGVIVDPPTGETWDSTVYSPWPLVLIFAATSYYYFVRATRLNHALQPTAASRCLSSLPDPNAVYWDSNRRSS